MSDPGGSIPQLLILNSEMNLIFFPILGGPLQNFLSWTEKLIWKFFQSRGVDSTTFDPELRNELNFFFQSCGGAIPQLLILNWEMNLKFFSNLGDPFYNFWSWTEKWEIYIDVFYGVSYNIKCITAISNLHFQQKK